MAVDPRGVVPAIEKVNAAGIPIVNYNDRVKGGKFVLIPFRPDTHGHGTHTWAAFWKDDLADLLKRSGG